MEKMKKCSSCGKDIKMSAVKCRYCGCWLEDQRVKPMGTQDPSKLKGEKTRKIILWLFVILIGYILLCVILMQLGIESPITAPMDTLFELTL